MHRSDHHTIIYSIDELIKEVKRNAGRHTSTHQRIRVLNESIHRQAFLKYLRTGHRDPFVMKIIDLTASPDDFIRWAMKYDPNQPRDPAGTPTGGRWTSQGTNAGADNNPPVGSDQREIVTDLPVIGVPDQQTGVIPPKYNIFVGGAGDQSYGHAVLNSSALNQDIAGVNYYSPHDGRSDINDLIAQMHQQYLERSINLIGHSWGGDTAAKIAIDTLGAVDRLVTVDPVSWFPPNLQDVRASVRNWININAAPTGNLHRFYPDNFVSGAGSYWGDTPQVFANQHISLPFNHEQFDAMIHAPIPALGNLSIVRWLNK